MKNITKMLMAVVAITSLSTYAFAGSIGFGVTGSYAAVGATGSENQAKNVNKKTSARNVDTALGTIFAEYSFDGLNGLTFGYDYTPGDTTVNDATLSRTDTETSVEGNAVVVSNSVTRSAQATLDNHVMYYAELPIHGGLYLKAGLAQMDVITNESFAGSKAYGNKSVDGTLYGIGIKNEINDNWYYKVEGSYTDYDSFSLSQTGQSANSTVNKITVDSLDVTKATFALAYKF